MNHGLIAINMSRIRLKRGNEISVTFWELWLLLLTAFRWVIGVIACSWPVTTTVDSANVSSIHLIGPAHVIFTWHVTQPTVGSIRSCSFFLLFFSLHFSASFSLPPFLCLSFSASLSLPPFLSLSLSLFFFSLSLGFYFTVSFAFCFDSDISPLIRAN